MARGQDVAGFGVGGRVAVYVGDRAGMDGGEASMKVNREDVVQAALTVERWCAYHWKRGVCDVECPFIRNDLGNCKIGCLGG